DVVGKLLLAVPWSPVLDVDLAGVPADPGADHELSLYMEDTGWPHASLDEYLGLWERIYLPMLEAADRDRPRLLDVHAVFQTAHGHGAREAGGLVRRPPARRVVHGPARGAGRPRGGPRGRHAGRARGREGVERRRHRGRPGGPDQAVPRGHAR